MPMPAMPLTMAAEPPLMNERMIPIIHVAQS
jgi:hypothetical protein